MIVNLAAKEEKQRMSAFIEKSSLFEPLLQSVKTELNHVKEQILTIVDMKANKREDNHEIHCTDDDVDDGNAQVSSMLTELAFKELIIERLLRDLIITLKPHLFNT